MSYTHHASQPCMDTPRRDEVTFTLTTPADTQPSSTVILRFPSRPRWNPLATRVGDSCGIAPTHLALAYADRHGRELVLRGDDDLRMAYAIAASMGEARQLRYAVLSAPRANMRRPADKPLPHLPFLSDTPRTSPARLFTCGICLEYGELSAVHIQGCRHRFCRDCVRRYVRAKLEERRFPVACPLCTIDDDMLTTGEINSSVLDELGLDECEYAKLLELELSVHSVLVTCGGCNRSIFVDRAEYNSENVIACPLPHCSYAWCKICSKSVPPGGPAHVCGDGSVELRRLMSEQGWQDCPGCKTPISRTEGCNHITCITPGCNVHFCYKCGSLITKSVKHKAIEKAKAAHYKKCEMFATRPNQAGALQLYEPLPYDLDALRALRAAPIGVRRRWWRFWM